MILISHRGNTNGRFEPWENEPSYIDMAIEKGFNVEVDVWCQNNTLYLGHDKPLYALDFRWFRDRLANLWLHCKNIEALEFFKNLPYDCNYFWHENDKATITSKKYIISHVNQEPIDGSIAMMPEIHNFGIEKCVGVCSDFIDKYKRHDSTDIRN